MTGILAILNTDGAPCHMARLQELTRAAAFRGPEGNGVKTCGEVGLGATLFRTTDESVAETQPLSLDGQVWVVADCRIDDRAAFVAELRGAGCAVRAGAADVELILHAYVAWGPRCVERLLGDFSFVIWDRPNRTLFAARDHFGVKPLFYAQVGPLLIVSNTLDCIGRHPKVPSEVNEAAIGEFLLFGRYQSPALTAFRHIHRLPAAHRLCWSDGALRVECYWEVPIYEKPLRLQRGEVVERFCELLRTAVSDRVRGRVAAIELSGGVDSTSIATTVFGLRGRNTTEFSFSAWTYDARPLVRGDEESDLARQTASVLGIPLHRWSFEGYSLFRDAAGERVRPSSDLRDLSFVQLGMDFTRAIAGSSRVLLTGQGGDGVFLGEPLNLRKLLRDGRWFPTAGNAVSYSLRRHKPPPLGIRAAIKKLVGISPDSFPQFPCWIEPAFARRQHLRERWGDLWWSRLGPPSREVSTAVRPHATRCLRYSWAWLLEQYDAQWNGVALDCRHPFLDRRVIDFVLQMPPIPWFWHKDLPRQACLGVVPSRIRNRPKTRLVGNPVRLALERGDRLPDDWKRYPALHQYVCCERLPETLQPTSKLDDCHLTAIQHSVSLSLWLQNGIEEPSDQSRGHG